MKYDYIIIGAGIAGLYSAYNIIKKYPEKTFIILESNFKKYIGGRVHQELFNNHLVTTGAGIGRYHKDKYLIKLLDELNIKYKKIPITPEYTFEPIDIIKIYSFLKKEFINQNKPRITFKEFTLPLLGEERYKKLLSTSGYTDYENDDIEHVLYMYGFEDNACCWDGFLVPWNELINKLIEKIGIKNIKTNSKVIKINNNNDFINVLTEKKKEFSCNKLVVATTIETLRQLFKSLKIYKQIEAQPFIRIYGFVSKSYIPIMKEKINGTLVVNNELHKIISYSSDDGLYMIGYSDNKDAIKLNKIMNNIITSKERLELIIKKELKIDDFKLDKIKSFYFKEGTHYYKPLEISYKSRKEFIKKAQNPEKNIYIVGEVVSENQGWVNSALESFHKVKIY